jgi:SAM-dependent methyltransferase
MARKLSVTPRAGVRDAYATIGVQRFYEDHAADYRNPHEQQVREIVRRNHQRFDCTRVLDLACGGGEVTRALQELGYTDFLGVDPHTCALYGQKSGSPCLAYSFDDILRGKLRGSYSVIICSFGLHLIEESKLPLLVQQLLLLSDTIAIITPHKRPELEKYGVRKVHEDFVLTAKGKKVKLKVYKR